MNTLFCLIQVLSAPPDHRIAAKHAVTYHHDSHLIERPNILNASPLYMPFRGRHPSRQKLISRLTMFCHGKNKVSEPVYFCRSGWMYHLWMYKEVEQMVYCSAVSIASVKALTYRTKP